MTVLANSMTNRNRLILMVLVAIFVLPIAAATTVFYLAPPTPSAHHGELLSPPLALQSRAFVTLHGETAQFRDLRTDWQLVFVLESCEDRCGAEVDLLQRMQQALGKDAHRVTPLLVTSIPPETWPSPVKLWVGALDVGIYLVDEQGFAALRYPLTTSPQGVLKDLRRLLKYAKG